MKGEKGKYRRTERFRLLKLLSSRYFIITALFFVSVIIFLRLWKETRWDGLSRITLIINSQPLAVFSIEPRSKHLLILTFPGNTILDVPYGYGTYPASSVFRLGTLDSKRGGALLLSKSIENTFGIVVEGIFALKTGTFPFPALDEGELVKIKKSYFSAFGALISFPRILDLEKKFYTDISFIDLFRLWNAVRKLRSDQITVMNIEKTRALSDDKLSDGTSVKTVDRDLFDFVISDYFQDQMIRAQNETVEIVNASGREKLAASFSRVLTHLGVNVISKTSAKEPYDFSCLVVITKKSSKESYLIKRLRELYACNIKKEPSQKSPADIKIILGKNYLK